jgi:hypothetical protein
VKANRLYNGLPVFKLQLAPGISGIRFNSFVAKPAIDVVDDALFVALSAEDTKEIKMSVNNEKRIVIGPTMIPGIPIYRNDADGNGNPGYWVLTKEDIEKIHIQFSIDNFANKNNVEHQPNTELSSTVEIEKWFIQDPANDKATALGFNLPAGTQMTSTFFRDEQLWNDNIKTGKWKGYSIEGNLQAVRMGTEKIELGKYPGGWDQCVLDMTAQYGSKAVAEKVCGAIEAGTVNQKIDNKNKINMNEKTNVSMLAEVVTDAGITLRTPDPAFQVGSAVSVVNADGTETPAPDKDWTTSDGYIITTVGGSITMIVDPQGNESVADPAAPAAAAEPTPAPAAASAEPAPADLEKELLTKTLADLIARLDSIEANLSKVEASLAEQAVKLSRVPASNSIKNADIKLTGTKVVQLSTKSYMDMTVDEKAAYLRSKNK